MIKSTVEKMADPIGFEIGMSDDVIQSDLINGFCRGLTNSIPDKHNLDMQICAIVEKLDKKSINIIKGLAEFVKTKEGG